MFVPEMFHKVPVHVVEAVALLAACRAWVPRLPSDHIVPVGCDNMAVVLSYRGGKAKNYYWLRLHAYCGEFSQFVAPSSLSGMFLRPRTAVMVSPAFATIILPTWTGTGGGGFLDDCFFELDENSPFRYQVSMQGDSRQPSSASGPSPLPRGATTTWRQGCSHGTGSAPSLVSPPSQPRRKVSSCSSQIVHCDMGGQSTPLGATSARSGGCTYRGESSFPPPPSSYPLLTPSGLQTVLAEAPGQEVASQARSP